MNFPQQDIQKYLIKITLYEEFKNDSNPQRINYRQTFNSFGEINDNIENYDYIEQSKNDIDNIIDNEINEDNKLNKNMSGFYINEIKNAYTNEKNGLIIYII